MCITFSVIKLPLQLGRSFLGGLANYSLSWKKKTTHFPWLTVNLRGSPSDLSSQSLCSVQMNSHAMISIFSFFFFDSPNPFSPSSCFLLLWLLQVGFNSNSNGFNLLMLPVNTFCFFFSFFLNDDAQQQKQILSLHMCLNYGCNRRREMVGPRMVMEFLLSF